jgi:hypothetical protein
MEAGSEILPSVVCSSIELNVSRDSDGVTIDFKLNGVSAGAAHAFLCRICPAGSFSATGGAHVQKTGRICIRQIICVGNLRCV